MFSSGHQLWNLDNTGKLENKANLSFSSGWSFEYETDNSVYIKHNDLYLSLESDGTIVLDSNIDNSTSKLWLNVTNTTDYFTIINVAARNSLLTSTLIHPLTLEGKLSTTY